MKVQMIVITPVGKYVGKICEVTEEENQNAQECVKADLTYLSFVDENDTVVIVKKECLSNSVIQFHQ